MSETGLPPRGCLTRKDALDSVLDMHPDDIKRMEEIDAGNAARVLCPHQPMYWELDRARAQALEAEAARWHQKFLEVSGQLAHYKRLAEERGDALEAIAKHYPFTSVAGEQMSRVAHKVLGRKFKPTMAPKLKSGTRLKK